MEFIYLFIIGLCIGSFANVLIDRWSHDQSINGRSHCDYCKKTLSPQDLIPVFSYLFLRGKCRYCQKKLSLFYPFVELLTAVVFVLSWKFLPGSIVERVSYLGISTCMIVIFFSDLKYQLISEKIILAMTVLATVFFLKNPLNHLSGALILAFLIYLIHFFTKGKGMGFGDVELAFVMGWLQGLTMGFISLYLSFIFGGIYAIIFVFIQKISNKKKTKIMKTKIAFGPFMIFSMFLTIFFSKQLLDIFHGIFGWL